MAHAPRSVKVAFLAALTGLGAGLASQPVAAQGDVADTIANVQPITDQKVNSPKEALRLRLFGDTAVKPACGSVKIDPRGVTGLDKDLDDLLKEVLAGIVSKDTKKLQPLFHPRLKVSLKALDETLAKLDFVYGSPLDTSIYRLWALNSVDGNPAGLSCPDDHVVVYPSYGYPLQFAAWLQIMGQKELGRVYLGVVPFENHWVVGTFHAQQWTHDGRDYATWAEEGVKAERMGFKEAAFIKYDIAAKLLEGGGFVDIAMRDDILKTRDAMLPTTAWDKEIKDTLKGFDVAYTSTLLVIGGGGILTRIRMPGEISLDQLKDNCHKVATTLVAQPWATYVEGVRCSYLLPKEDAKLDGKMGGIYIPFADVRPQPSPYP